jgi:3-hydroxyisobutyrate dehydrogenase-like beta-hydroxyacid dehydrogenase
MAPYDIKTDDSGAADAMRRSYAALGVEGASDAGAALKGRAIAFCLVTADQSFSAAEAAARVIGPGTLWADGTSSSPATKKRSAEILEASGARYVDMAIMAPVHPRLHRTPVLLSGPHAEAALALLQGLDMQAEIAGERVGDASSIKMIRSVMVKGMEALTAECLLAAKRAGVEQAVLASLGRSHPDIEWARRSSYNIERMRLHGKRRAAEMREVASTLRELGLPDRMAAATASWEEQVGRLGLAGSEASLDEELKRVLAAIG